MFLLFLYGICTFILALLLRSKEFSIFFDPLLQTAIFFAPSHLSVVRRLFSFEEHLSKKRIKERKAQSSNTLILLDYAEGRWKSHFWLATSWAQGQHRFPCSRQLVLDRSDRVWIIWSKRIRTFACRYQKPMPYHLAILHTALFGTVERGEVRYRRDRVRKRKPTEKLWRRREKEEKKRRQVWTKIKDALLKEVNMSLSMRRRTMNHIFFKNKVQSSVNYGKSGGLLRLITDSPTDKSCFG